MNKEDISSAAWEFLQNASGGREALRGYEQANFQTFFDDIGALGEEGARNVLLVMMGHMNKVPPKEYKTIFDKGWRFPLDFDPSEPNKYGYDEEGFPLSGTLAASPNGLNSVSIFDVSRQLESEQLYRDFFGKVLDK